MVSGGAERPYRVVDADGHVTEPVDEPDKIMGPAGDPGTCSTIWREYMDPGYRDETPVLFVAEDAKTRMRAEGRVIGGHWGTSAVGVLGMPAEPGETIHDRRLPQGRPGGYDPHARVADLDVDGIDTAVLYPSIGLLTGAIKDPGLAAAVSRAYNRWLADYCSAYPDRLVGVAMLPMQSVELAAQEVRYAREELGMQAGFVRPNPYNGVFLGDREYDPLWAVAQELDFSIGVHEGTGGGGMRATGADRVRDPTAEHIVSHTLEMMVACLNIVWGGVCERFPRLRFAFLESGGGWVASWLDRMDRHFEQKEWNVRQFDLKLHPSEYFRRQCWISLEPTEQILEAVAEYVGPTHVLWATDYPHIDGFFPGAPKMIEGRLREDLRPLVMGQGAVDFYQLD